MPTDNRATAERIAPFTLADAERYVLRMGTTNEQDIADAVNDDRKHRNREAASKALGYIYGQLAARPVVDKDVALAVVLHAVQSKEGYLAAEFDAGERTECERCGGLMPAHERQYAHHQELAACVDFLAATIKRLAKQRGAER